MSTFRIVDGYATNNFYVSGTLYAQSMIVSSSQVLTSGSTIWGDSSDDTHQFTGSVFVKNAFQVAGNTTLLGDLAVTGAFSVVNLSATNTVVSNDLYVLNDAFISGTLTAQDFTVNDDLTLTDDLYVLGDAFVSGTLAAQDLTVNDDLTVTDDLYVLGDTFVSGTLKVLDLTVVDDLTLTDDLYVLGDAFISGTLKALDLTVIDDLILTDDLYVLGDSYVSGTLTAQNLSVSDDLTVSDDLYVSGNLFSSGTLTISGVSSFKDTIGVTELYVSGDSYVSGTLTAQDLTVNDDLSVTDDLYVSGDSYVSGSSTFGVYGSGHKHKLIGDCAITGTFFQGTSLSANNPIGTDATFYVSGTVGGKGIGGTSVFGGDVVVSGAMFNYISSSDGVANYPVYFEPATYVPLASLNNGSNVIDIWNTAEAKGPALYTKVCWTTDEVAEQSGSVIWQKPMPAIPNPTSTVNIIYDYVTDTTSSGNVKVDWTLGSDNGTVDSFSHVIKDLPATWGTKNVILSTLTAEANQKIYVKADLYASGSATGSIANLRLVL
jgi:cytoskeletal protein CcmA (bactofilin family)